MFFIHTSSSLAFHSIKKSLLNKYKASHVSCIHNLETANLKDGVFIIDDNELSHKKVLAFLLKIDLSKVLVFINELRAKEITRIANLGIKHLISYHSIEKNLLEAINQLKKMSLIFPKILKLFYLIPWCKIVRLQII